MPTYRYPDPYIRYSTRSITAKKLLPNVKDPYTNLLADPFCGYNYFKGCGTDTPYFQPICSPDWCGCAIFRGTKGFQLPNVAPARYEVPHIIFRKTEANSPDLDLGTSDFTIEVTYEHQDQKGTPLGADPADYRFGIITVIRNHPGDPNVVRDNFWSFGVTGNGGLYFDISIGYTGFGRQYARFETAPFLLSSDTQYRLEFRRLGGRYYFFINGVDIPFFQAAGVFGQPSSYNLLNGDPFEYLSIFLGLRSFFDTNNLNEDNFGVGPLTGSICDFKITKNSKTVHETHFDCYAFQTLPDLWRDIVFNKTPTSDDLCFSVPPECSTLLPDSYDPELYAVSVWTINAPGEMNWADSDSDDYDPTPPSNCVDNRIHLFYNAPFSGACGSATNSNFLTSPQYNGQNISQQSQPQPPAVDFRQFILNLTLTSNDIWTNIYGGEVYLLNISDEQAQIVFITNRSIWQTRFGLDICNDGPGLKACYVRQCDGTLQPDPFESTYETFCCDPSPVYDPAIDIISRVGDKGKTGFVCNKPFKRSICGDPCNLDTTSCKEEDLIEFQFNFADKLSTFDPDNQSNPWNLYQWSPSTDPSVDWFGTVEAFDFDTNQRVAINFDYFVQKHVNGRVKYRSQLNLDPVQIVKINPYFLPCRFYFKFTIRTSATNIKSFYTEPFEKITCVGNTVKLKGDYPDGSKDCLGRYYGKLTVIDGNPTWSEEDSYDNSVRVHGELSEESFVIETEEQRSTKFIKVLKSNLRDVYRFRTKPIPPYMVLNIKYILSASSVSIDGFRYTFNGTAPKAIDSGRMWLLDIPLNSLDICSTNDYTCV